MPQLTAHSTQALLSPCGRLLLMRSPWACHDQDNDLIEFFTKSRVILFKITSCLTRLHQPCFQFPSLACLLHIQFQASPIQRLLTPLFADYFRSPLTPSIDMIPRRLLAISRTCRFLPSLQGIRRLLAASLIIGISIAIGDQS